MNKNRPSIFQSFDALKGFREMIEAQERVVVKKRILSEDDLEILDRKIHLIKEGMMVKITYFDKNQYVLKEGILAKINYNTKFIQVVKTKINMKDIVDIQCDEIDKYFE